MTLKDRLNDDLRTALRGGDEARKVTIRGALAAIRNAEDAAVKARLDAAGADTEPAAATAERAFDDAAVLQVLQRQVKQRQDSIEEFRKAGRQDLVEKEAAEVAILQQYLPRQMSRDEIAREAEAVIAETGVSGPAAKGTVMPALIKRLAGRADGREINAIVTELLARGSGA